jgi:hypothetical protein
MGPAPVGINGESKLGCGAATLRYAATVRNWKVVLWVHHSGILTHSLLGNREGSECFKDCFHLGAVLRQVNIIIKLIANPNPNTFLIFKEGIKLR